MSPVGLPVGRLRRPALALRAVLNATAVGVLLFLLWDVFSAAWEPIHTGLGALHDGTGTLAPVLGYGALFAGGLGVGRLGLVGYDRHMARVAAAARTGPWAMGHERR
jgi:ZIP family zinc transporter